MKLYYRLLLMVVPIVLFVGCSVFHLDDEHVNVQYEQDEQNVEHFVGSITIIDNVLYVDRVEIITHEDSAKMYMLGLTLDDMPNGYYIHRLNKEIVSFELTEETIYTFVDFHLLFIEYEDGDRLYSTTAKEEFLLHFNTSYLNYNETPYYQKVPFFISVRAGKVLTLTEEFLLTI